MNYQFINLKQICDTWAIRKDTNAPSLDTFYYMTKDLDFSPLIYAFTSRLKEIPCSFSKSEQVSGSICFFGGIFTSLLHYGYIEEIEGLFTFALCYMLIDHFLDDNQISPEEKTQSMKDIANLIYGKEVNSNNKLIQAAEKRYTALINRVPNCLHYLQRLFESELKGTVISNCSSYPRETYLEIEKEKGGLTAAAIGSIISLSKDKIDIDAFKLGACIQLVDNFIDIQDDSDLGIYTTIRYDLEKNNVDQYVYETLTLINSLDNVYNFFKPILIAGVILGIHDNPGCISIQLEEVLQPYFVFAKTTSKYSLNTWFHDKLYSYIDVNRLL